MHFAIAAENSAAQAVANLLKLLKI